MPSSRHHRSARRAACLACTGLALATGAVLPITGCSEPTYVPRHLRGPAAPTRSEVRLDDHRGGTHWSTLEIDGLWYQAFGPTLLVLDIEGAERRDNARVVQEIDTSPFGTVGPIVDMARDGDLLHVVHDGDALVTYSLLDPRDPKQVARVESKELGVRPRLVSATDAGVFVSGDGGLVRADRPGTPRVFTCDPLVSPGRAVLLGESTWMPLGGEIISLEDGSVGARADAIVDVGIPGRAVIAEQGRSGAGLELVDETFTRLDMTATRGVGRRVRMIDDELWVITDSEIMVVPVTAEKFGVASWIRVRGARDVAKIADNRYAIAGSFGRAIYRRRADDGGPADGFFAVVREPGELAFAVSDGRRVRCGGDEGTWLYTIGDRVEESPRPIEASTPPTLTLTSGGGTVEIQPDGGLLVSIVPPAGPDGAPLQLDPKTVSDVWRAAPGARARTLMAEGDVIWVGHDEGITAIQLRDQASIIAAISTTTTDGPPPVIHPWIEVGRVRLDGPVDHLFPKRVGKGAVFVARFGGVGVIEIEKIPITPDDAADAG